MSEIIRDETCCKRFGVLSGPNLAAEILAKAPSAAVVASGYDEVLEEIQRFISRPHFRVYGSRDLIGVELPDTPQPLLQVCTALLQAEVNISQVYPLLSRPRGRPAVALMVDSIEMAIETLASKGFAAINEDDLKDTE